MGSYKRKSQRKNYLLAIASVGVLVLPVAAYFLGDQFFDLRKRGDQVKAVEEPIVIDHRSVELFDQIPDGYISMAAAKKVLFWHASVGGNISDGLNCLMDVRIDGRRPNYCDRELTPDQIIYDSKYNRSNWVFEYHDPVNPNPAWWNKARLFVDRVNNLGANETYDVVGYKFGYVDAYAGSNLDDMFFRNNPDDTLTSIEDILALEVSHPDKQVMYWTVGLARAIGTADAASFNAQMRSFARENNKVLMDIADIESHRPDGTTCTDNRGLGIEAICQEYTQEVDAGHLNSLGKQRMAKAVWVMMAYISGWRPGVVEDPGEVTNQAPLVNAGGDFTALANESVSLRGLATDDGLPGTGLTIMWEKVSGPGSVVIANPASLQTMVQFADSGEYQLRLTAQDGQLSASDLVNVRVSDQVGGQESLFSYNFDTISGCDACKLNNIVFNPSGLIGGAYQFNGTTSYMTISEFGQIKGKNAFSVAMWLKPNFTQTEANFRYALSDGNTLQLFFLPNIDDWRTALRTSNGTFRVDTSNLTWEENSWHHIAVTYDGANLRFFWDGQQKGMAAATGVTATDTMPLSLGRSSVGSNYFSGQMDQMEVFGTALSESQISGLANL